MTKGQVYSASARLGAATWLSLALVWCVTLSPRSSPAIRPEPHYWMFWGTHTLAAVILVALAPVFRHGTKRDRWRAALYAAFPIMLFIILLTRLLQSGKPI